MMNSRRQSRDTGSPEVRRAAAATALIGLLAHAAPSSAQDLRAAPLAELQYTAGAGQVFELQGSNDLTAWRNVRDVVFGESQAVSESIAVPTTGAAYRFYRVKISAPKPFGFAPGTLDGKQIAFNDEGEAPVYSFDSRATGRAGGESFAYHYRKLGDTLARLDIELGDGWSEQIELDFSADLVGRFTCSTRRDGRLTDIDSGTFSFHRSALDLGRQQGDPIPATLGGDTYLFSDGVNHERFDFVTSDSGRRVDRAEITDFDYSYARAGDSATATVGLPGNLTIEFEMQFGSGSCGTYQRREFVDGELEHRSDGIFSFARSIYHTEGAESTDVTLPASELTGLTYVMNDGGTPCQLQFQSPDSGRCIQGKMIDEIRYDYSVNCNATSIITVRFGAGEFDRYHLNHSDLTFSRREIRGGIAVDTDSGTFAEAP